MAAVRCPTIVGRGTEVSALHAAVAAARLGRGGAVALVGPPGIGKSRLARETAATAQAWDMPVLVGRGVETGGSTAFRPIGEALLTGLRRRPEPTDPALVPFRPTLGRFVPQWRTATTVDDSLVVLGEAVLRLLVALAGRRGLVLVLEDLHWADLETLAVLEYLADNIAEERVLLLVSTRNEQCAAGALIRALAERHTCSELTLTSLDAGEIEAMAGACLRTSVPADVLAVLRRRTGGIPLLVEELLTAGADPAAVIPATVAELVAGRVNALHPAHRRCVEAAAVLGPQFDWRLLPPMVGTTDAEVHAALRAAIRAGLVQAQPGDGFTFHHALSRDAVLDALLPPERTEWARRGFAAVADAHPGLDGGWGDLAADLALRAGDAERAAGILVEAGRGNLARGALASAETVLRRATDLVAQDSPLAADADEVLSEVLVQAGKTVDAVDVTTRTIRRLRRTAGAHRALAEAHLRLARGHATAGEWTAAAVQIDSVDQDDVGEDLRLQITLAAAQVALGGARFADAHRLATAALTASEHAGASEIACQALLVLGRIARRSDLALSEELFERARTVAEGAGLAVVAARALYEISITDALESLRLDRLDTARERAGALGDIAAVAVLDLQRAATFGVRWEPEPMMEAVQLCVSASRRFRLATLPKALVFAGAAQIYPGQAADAEIALAEVLRLAPDDVHLLGEVWGVRAQAALAVADDGRALQHLERAMHAYSRQPDEVTGSPWIGLWVLMSLVADPDLTVPPSPPDPIANRWNRGLLRFADAVALGRAGDAAAAVAAFAAADSELREPVDVLWHRLQARRLTAVAAIADGWGDPVTWASEDLPVLEARGQERLAAAARGLLRSAGAVVPRRGRGATTLPAALHELGITSREADVLLLLCEGKANRDIAERLFLSPRTVEKHVERLLAKTGTTRRTELMAYAARIFDPPRTH